MALLDAQAQHSSASAQVGPVTAPVTGPAARPRRPRTGIVTGELLTLLAVLVAAVFVSSRLNAWGDQGLDFSVYWHGGKVLNEAGPAPSGLFRLTLEWAGGPQLPFT